MKTLAEFVKDNGITIEVVPISSNPLMPEDMFHYSVTIDFIGRKMTVPFSCGAAWVRLKEKIPHVPFNSYSHGARKHLVKLANPYYDFTDKKYKAMFGSFTYDLMDMMQVAFEPRPPTVEDVLDSLASDSTVLDAGGFESWCSELGYDTDSIKAKRTYDTCVEQAIQLKALLGQALFDQLLYETERL